MREKRYSLTREEIQRMLDEASDQAATQAAAIVLNKMREALRLAIHDILRDAGRDALEYVLHERWIRIVLGLLSLAGLIGYWLNDRMI